MAFIDEFNKLVVKQGKQAKITDKDKAIILIANELSGENSRKNNVSERK